jgi:hypothetical protein
VPAAQKTDHRFNIIMRILGAASLCSAATAGLSVAPAGVALAPASVEFGACRGGPLAYGAGQTDRFGDSKRTPPMPIVTHVFWRGIPAQVIVGKGRSGAKRPLPERFEQAIDRCAMKIGAKDQDAYLAEWRRVEVGDFAGDPAEIAAAEAARLDAAYDTERLKRLIAADGVDTDTA